MGTDVEQLGVVGSAIVEKFSLNISPDTPIYIGLNNRIHMENSHREIYLTYCDRMSEIISSPDYVGINPHDNSLEYYKKFNNEVIHIKIAIRSTARGVYFARSMYSVNDLSLNNYINTNRLKEV